MLNLGMRSATFLSLPVALALKLHPGLPANGLPANGEREGFDFIVLASMGKVASTSLMEGLNAPYVDKNQSAYPPRFKTHFLPVLAHAFEHLPKGVERPLVITAFRNPFTRLVSWFFQTAADGDLPSLSWDRLKDMSVEELAAEFEGLMDSLNGTPGFRNFMHDLGDVLHLNSALDSFNYSAGHLFVKQRRELGMAASLLVLRFEDITRWQSIVHGFVPDFCMPKPENVGAEKIYAKKYKAFRSAYRFPRWLVDEVMRWDTWGFYTKSEQEAFIEEATGKLPLLNVKDGEPLDFEDW